MMRWATCLAALACLGMQPVCTAAVPPSADPVAVGPAIELTVVPPKGSNEDLRGRVDGADPLSHAVVVYIRVADTWWVKPTAAQPRTPIGANGSWRCDITTGGDDANAGEIRAYLVPGGYAAAPHALPAAGDALAETSVIRDRRIDFAGRRWIVKDGGNVRRAPGGNLFDDSTDSVWVDANGLHLKIRNVNGTWKCAEVYTEGPLQYGMHRLYVVGRIDALDPNVICAGFLYEHGVGEDAHELDIEFTTWGQLPAAAASNGQFVVFKGGNGVANTQPGEFVREGFQFALSGTYTTHSIHWTAGRVVFKSFHDHSPEPLTPGHLIHTWTAASHVPTPTQDMRLHVNAWLYDADGDGMGDPPTDGQDVEFVIRAADLPAASAPPAPSDPQPAPTPPTVPDPPPADTAPPSGTPLPPDLVPAPCGTGAGALNLTLFGLLAAVGLLAARPVVQHRRRGH